MSAVVQYTSASILDTKIQLGEDQMVRTLDIGTWNTIRFGSRMCISSSVEKASVSPRTNIKFFYGFAATTSSAFADSNHTNVYGVAWHQVINWYMDLMDSASIMVTNGTGLKAFYANANTASYDGTSPRYFACGRAPTRSMFIIEFQKTASILNITSYLPNETSSVMDTTLQTLVDTITMPTISYTGYKKAGPFAQPFSATSSSLNSINIYWGSKYKPLEVSEVVYTIIN